MTKNMHKPIFSILATCTLIACGGGGESSSPAGGGGGSQPTSYTVSTSAGTGGSISPSSARVTSGNTTSFTVTPASNYGIDAVTGCGGSLNGSTYRTGSITANCTVTASFVELPSYQVTAAVDRWGSVNPTAKTVYEGNTTSFTIAPDPNMRIKSVEGCGGTLSDLVYTTGPINADCHVSVSIEEDLVSVNVEIVDGREGGAFLPGEDVTIKKYRGETFRLDFGLVDEFWQVSTVEGCPLDAIVPREGEPPRVDVFVGPINEDCVAKVTLTPPEDTNFNVAVPVAAFNGTHNAPAEGVKYGTSVTIDLAAIGPRDLTEWAVRPLNSVAASRCESAEWNGSSVTLHDVNGQCEVWAKFTAAGEYYFADPVLQQEFRDTWDLQPEELLTLDLVERVQDLYVSSQARPVVTDLEGIQAATGLKSLFINARLTTLEPLRGMNINRLWIGSHMNFISVGAPARNQVESFAPLATMPLTQLELSDMEPKDGSYAFLQQLPRLRTLALGNTRGVSDLSFLPSMPNLSIMRLTGTRVIDLRPLANSSLARASNFVSIFGCASEEQRVTQDLLQQAEQQSWLLVVSKGNTSTYCPTADALYEVEAVASLSDDAVQLEWDFTKGSVDAYMNCEIHYNRSNEQLNNPDVLVESCDAAGSIELPHYFDRYDVQFVIDDGVYDRFAVDRFELRDETIDTNQLRLTDVEWGQSVITSRPSLVPNRSVLFRAHMIADQDVAVPDATLLLELNGETHELAMNGIAGGVPSEPEYHLLEASYRVEIPAEWVQAGLQVSMVLNDEVIYSETPVVGAAHKLSISLFPMVVNGVSAEVELTAEKAREMLLHYFPLQDVELRIEEPFVYDTDGDFSPSTLLNALRDKYRLDGAQHHYHGIFPAGVVTSGLGIAGIASQGGNVGLTIDSAQQGSTFAHEIGHNLGLGHVDCGNPDFVMRDYPYPTDTIGSNGYDAVKTQIINKDMVKDVMSYCRPVFISDYSFNSVQHYLDRKPPKGFDAVDGAAMAHARATGEPFYSTLITGEIDQRGGQTRLRLVKDVNRPAGIAEMGPFTLVAEDVNGELLTRTFAVEPTGNDASERNGYFALQLPVQSSSLVAVRIYFEGSEIFSRKL